jgi:hypothetical protein
MATAKIKIHLYSVTRGENSPPLETLLEQIEKNSLPERLRTVGNQEMRLESVEQNKTNGLWKLDFGKLRFDNGPGRASRVDAIEGFKLQADEGFAEETAALYDPNKNHMLIQYNHHGVRVGSIEEYLSNYSSAQPNQYNFEPRLNANVEAKLKSARILRQFTLGVKLGAITEAYKKENISLSKALDFGNGMGALHMKIELGLGQNQASMLDGGKTRALIKWAQKLIGVEEESAIESLKVSAKQNVDSKLEIIDLLTPRLAIEFPDLPLGADLRVARSVRLDKLNSAHVGWKSIL